MKDKIDKYFKIVIIITTLFFIITGLLFVIIPTAFNQYLCRANNKIAISVLTSKNQRIKQCLNNVVKKAQNKCINVFKIRIRQTIFIPGIFGLANQNQNLIIIDKLSTLTLTNQELEIIIAHELGHLMLYSNALNTHPLSKIIKNFDKETAADVIAAFFMAKKI
jgi:beta-lactamase regulating signal transducer with metallopeptidase domain